MDNDNDNSTIIPLKKDSLYTTKIVQRQAKVVVCTRITAQFQNRFWYILCLLFALWMLERSTGTRIFLILQQHEPSIRIFRCLLEIFLLMLCTAISIPIWCHYLGVEPVERLLFQPPLSPHDDDDDDRTIRMGETKDDDVSSASEVEILFRDDQDSSSYEDSGDHCQLHQEESSTTTGSDEGETTIEFIGDIHDESSHTKDDITNNGAIGTPKQPLSPEMRQRPPLLLQQRPPPPQWPEYGIPSIAVYLLGSALDLLIWIMITLVLYTAAAIGTTTTTTAVAVDDNTLLLEDHRYYYYYYYWALFSSLAAPTFPLLLFVFVTIRAFFPLRKHRYDLLKVISYTLQAPWYEVSFRDGMIGDILTSMVRPMQDIAFTICYILFGLNQWWYLHSNPEEETTTSDTSLDGTQTITSKFVNAADANVPAMEKSWLLHTLILPACAISPLWCRFLQNMRQTHDNRRRWPYLGNAAKYFVAAQVAMFGVYHPEVKQNPIWLLSFVLATLYQIWWDLVMDWGLFDKEKNGSWVLRKKRLYSSRYFYWAMVVVNTMLRFCWTLSFIPLRYLSTTGVLTKTFTNNDGWAELLGPLIASAEIIRRSLWGLIRVEWEIVKNTQNKNDDDGTEKDDKIMMEVEMTPMQVVSSQSDGGRGTWFQNMSAIDSTRLVVELSVYTSIFAILGLLIAAHRETL